MTSDTDPVQEGTWTIPVSDKEKPRVFFVMHKTDWSNKKQIYTNGADRVATFMLGRNTSEYQLYINNRMYDWCKDPSHNKIVEHLEHIAALDEAFYPPEEFPRHHWYD